MAYEPGVNTNKEQFVLMWFLGDLTVEEMAKELNMEKRQLYRWKQDPGVQAQLEELIRAATIEARAVYAKNAKRAAQTTLLLLQTTPVKDADGKVIGHDLKYPNQARLAAQDIHQSLNIPVKAPIVGNIGGITGDNPSVMILLPEKKEVPGKATIKPTDEADDDNSDD